MRRLRILGLHGYHGSADLLRRQAAALFEPLAALADLVGVDAPSIALGDFGWWHADGTSGDPGVRERPASYRGWERTRQWAIEQLRAQRYDGVFGFSQGAALAALLAGLRAPDGRPTDARPLAFDFVMMAGGFASNDPVHAALLAPGEGLALPSLHLIGRTDTIVPAPVSRRLAGRFRDPVVVEHAGGHVIAHDAATRAAVEAFLRARAR
jgi:fermentation-respiration switch protein FrsA (DUF1100 family)